MELKERYLLTLRDTLTGATLDDGMAPKWPIRWLASKLRVRISQPVPKVRRDNGDFWPSTALTMVGTKRLDNIRHCIEQVLKNGVEGAIVECGVWRGGASIYAAGVLAAHEQIRDVYLCDSFQGLPKPSLEQDAGDPHWRSADFLSVSQEQVWENFGKFHLQGDHIHLVKGWFSQTLSGLPCDKIAVLRADGDMYESTMDIFKALYHRVPKGGYVIIDDYHAVPGCKLAVTEFLADKKVTIQPIDNLAVYWQV